MALPNGHRGGRKSRYQSKIAPELRENGPELRKNGPVRPSYPQARHHGPESEGGEWDGPSV